MNSQTLETDCQASLYHANCSRISVVLSAFVSTQRTTNLSLLFTSFKMSQHNTERDMPHLSYKWARVHCACFCLSVGCFNPGCISCVCFGAVVLKKGQGDHKDTPNYEENKACEPALKWTNYCTHPKHVPKEQRLQCTRKEKWMHW